MTATLKRSAIFIGFSLFMVAFTAVHSAHAVGHVTVSLSQSPANPVGAGTTVTIFFGSSGDDCKNGGNDLGTGSGSFTVIPPAGTTTTYTVKCSDSEGGQLAGTATISVTATNVVTPAPTVTLSASPASINLGASSTLTWTSTNATSCYSNSSGLSFGSTLINSSASVTPTSNSTYSITCSGTGGNTISNTVSVNINAAVPSITASPENIAPGGATQLTWSCTNSNSASIAASIGPSPGAEPVSGGPLTLTPTAGDTIYTLTCFGANGTNTTSTDEVVFNGPYASLTASPTNIASGGSSSLTYQCSDSTSGSISGIGTITADGVARSVSVSPGSSTSYTLSCVNSTIIITNPDTGVSGPETVKATATVSVGTSSTLGVSCSASPAPTTTGTNVTWTATPTGGGLVTYNWQKDGQETGESEEVCSTSQINFLPRCATGIKVGDACTSGDYECYAVSNPPTCKSSIEAQFRPVTSYACVRSVGAPTYSYTWSGAVTGTTNPITIPFPTVGTKTGTITVGDGITTANNSCSDAVYGPIAATSCQAAPSPATVGQAVTWSITGLSGGTGAYTYTWSGDESLSGAGATAAKTYTTAAAKAARVVISSPPSTALTLNCTSLTVNAAPAPDLTAGAVTPTAATAGTPVTLTATVTNSGTATTAVGFKDLFQKATDSSGTGSVDIGTYTSALLAAAAHNSATLSYTFASAGPWYVRVCADKASSADTGAVTESSEANNCGAWTLVTVAAAALPDLTVGNVSSSALLVGPTTLSVSIANGAAAATGGVFTDLFQKANDSSGTGAVDLGTYSNAALATSGSNTATFAYTFAAPATYYFRACADKSNGSDANGAIVESNEANNCSGAWTAFVVTSPPQPDLIASNVASSATVPGPTTLSATITNQGTAATGGVFTDLFQKANDSSGTGAVDLGTYSNAALASGGTHNTATFSYTFASGGTYYFRACADKASSADAGVIAESNEANNCSAAWQPIVVSYPTITSSCSVDKTTGNANDTYTWSATAASGGNGGPYTYTWSGTGLTGKTGSVAAVNSYSAGGPYKAVLTVTDNVSPTPDTSGPIDCTNWVTSVTAAPACSVLTATPSTINAGSSVTLTWSCQNVSSCTALPVDPNDDGFTTGSRVAGTDNSVTPSITSGQAIYGMTCDGQPFQFPPVTVVSPEATIIANPVRLSKGATSNISWTSSQVLSCVESGPGLAKSSLAGNMDEAINSQSTYTITCQSATGPVTDSITVNVNGSIQQF